MNKIFFKITNKGIKYIPKILLEAVKDKNIKHFEVSLESRPIKEERSEKEEWMADHPAKVIGEERTLTYRVILKSGKYYRLRIEEYGAYLYNTSNDLIKATQDLMYEKGGWLDKEFMSIMTHIREAHNESKV